MPYDEGKEYALFLDLEDLPMSLLGPIFMK
jgi:hypothetical protein